VRTTPIAFLLRARLAEWGPLLRGTGAAAAGDGRAAALPEGARAVLDLLAGRGAMFFDDLARSSGLLASQIEDALGALAARGLVTSDGFSGLRALLAPAARRRRRAARGDGLSGMESAGRFTLLDAAAGGGPADAPGASGAGASGAGAPGDGAAVEGFARLLLRRFGVVFRRLVEREGMAPPWRDLARAYRRLEARGEIRGGRFVDGFAGEQFALPDAVGALRAVRRRARPGELVALSAADPLALAGLVTPGARVSALPGNRVLFRDGEPIAVREAGEVRFLADLPPAARWQAHNALLRRPGVPLRRAAAG
jgi:ATP-dependent Lhr-like helicase